MAKRKGASAKQKAARAKFVAMIRAKNKKRGTKKKGY